MEPVWEMLSELSFEYNHSPVPPQEFIEGALSLLTMDQSPIIVSYRYDWILLREPTLSEINAYEQAMSYVHRSPVPILKSKPYTASPDFSRFGQDIIVKQSSVMWLLRKCIVLPLDYIDNPDLDLCPGIAMRLMTHLLKSVNAKPEEIKKMIVAGSKRSKTIPETMSSVLRAYDVNVSFKDSSLKKAYQSLTDLDSVYEMKKILRSGKEVELQDKKSQKGKLSKDERQELLRKAREGGLLDIRKDGQVSNPQSENHITNFKNEMSGTNISELLQPPPPN